MEDAPPAERRVLQQQEGGHPRVSSARVRQHPPSTQQLEQLLLLNMQRFVQRQREAERTAAAAAIYAPPCSIAPIPLSAPGFSQPPASVPRSPYGPTSGTGLYGAFRAVYVNLDSRADRRASIEANLHAVGMSALRFRALQGKDVSQSLVLPFWDSTINSHFDVKTLPARLQMTPGERGCAASHACLWQQVAALPLDSPPLLVLEDDVCFSPRIVEECASRIALVEAILPPEQRQLLLYPGAEVAAWRAPEAAAWPDAIRWREAHYLWQTSSYVLWPAAARVLLRHLPIDAPVDVFIAKLVMTQALTALVAQPVLAWQAVPYRNGDIRHSNVYKQHVAASAAQLAALSQLAGVAVPQPARPQPVAAAAAPPAQMAKTPTTSTPICAAVHDEQSACPAGGHRY